MSLHDHDDCIVSMPVQALALPAFFILHCTKSGPPPSLSRCSITGSRTWAQQVEWCRCTCFIVHDPIGSFPDCGISTAQRGSTAERPCFGSVCPSTPFESNRSSPARPNKLNSQSFCRLSNTDAPVYLYRWAISPVLRWRSSEREKIEAFERLSASSFFQNFQPVDLRSSTELSNRGGAVANRLRRRTSDQAVLGSNPAVAAAFSPWTRLFTPIVPRRSLHISFY